LIDISDPEDPNSLGTIRVDEPQKLTVTQNFAYAIIQNNNNETELGIFNINDPRGGFSPSYFSMEDRWSCFTVFGVYVFIAQSGRIDILDFSDRNQPELVASYDNDFAPADMVMDGDFLFLACSSNGIEVVDISDIENPVSAGYYNTPGRAVDIESSNGFIYVADYTNFGIYEFIPPNGISKGTEVDPVLQTEFSITSIYPNPFNSSTTISYALSVQSDVSLQIINLRGQLVDVLVDRVMLAGMHSVVWDAENMSAGVYLISMREEGGRMMGIQKVVLVR